jgi:hypothetical protein
MEIEVLPKTGPAKLARSTPIQLGNNSGGCVISGTIAASPNINKNLLSAPT